MYEIQHWLGRIWKPIERGINVRDQAVALAMEIGTESHPARVINEKEVVIFQTDEDLE
jgi:hypothetical protein